MGQTEGIKFRGIRDLPTLTNFINNQMADYPHVNILLNSIY